MGFSAFGRHIHATEDLLAALRERADLSGDDFVPTVVKLGELMDYRAQMSELRDRISQFQAVANSEPGQDDDDIGVNTDVILAGESQLRLTTTLPNLLNSLAETVAADYKRSVRLLTSGLDAVPTAHAARVRDVCVQMIRNSIVHGVEESAERLRVGKSATATIAVSFETEELEHYVLRIEDDGRGLNYEEILDHALRLGLVSPDQAVAMKPEAVLKLILEPGFTTAEAVTVHAGRGVGLNLVSDSLRECGGRLAIGTNPGAYTRFVVRLPKLAVRGQQSSVA